MAKTNPAFMSGVPELLILRLLARKEMYGYELVKDIKLASNEAFNLAEGVVYPSLHSMEKKKFLKATDKKVSGRNRVYYSVTAKGRKRLLELSNEWTRIKQGVEAALEESYG